MTIDPQRSIAPSHRDADHPPTRADCQMIPNPMSSKCRIPGRGGVGGVTMGGKGERTCGVGPDAVERVVGGRVAGSEKAPTRDERVGALC